MFEALLPAQKVHRRPVAAASSLYRLQVWCCHLVSGGAVHTIQKHDLDVWFSMRVQARELGCNPPRCHHLHVH